MSHFDEIMGPNRGKKKTEPKPPIITNEPKPNAKAKTFELPVKKTRRHHASQEMMEPTLYNPKYAKALQESRQQYNDLKQAEKVKHPHRSHHRPPPVKRPRGRPRNPEEGTIPIRPALLRITGVKSFRDFIIHTQYKFRFPQVSNAPITEAEFAKRLLTKQSRGGGARGLAMYISQWISPIMKEMHVKPIPREEMAIFIPKAFTKIGMYTLYNSSEEVGRTGPLYSYDDIFNFFYKYIFQH